MKKAHKKRHNTEISHKVNTKAIKMLATRLYVKQHETYE